MFCLSRVSVSKPTIRPADVLEASRMCFADAKANMLHGERRNPHRETRKKTFCVGFYMLFSLQDCPSWSSALSSPWSTWTMSTRESPSTSRWFTTVRHKRQRPQCHMYCPLVAGRSVCPRTTKIQNCPEKKGEEGKLQRPYLFWEVASSEGNMQRITRKLIFESRIFRLLKE